jgi:hypothetical protein
MLGGTPSHSLMQLLPTTIQSVAANDRVDFLALLAFEVVPEAAKVLVGLAHMLQLTQDKLDNDDVVEIANNGNIVREYVFRVREVHKRRQQIGIRSPTKSGKGSLWRISSSTSRMASMISTSPASRTALRDCLSASRKNRRSRSVSSKEIFIVMSAGYRQVPMAVNA